MKISLFSGIFKNCIWIFGTLSLLFGVFDRVFSALADSYLSNAEVLQLVVSPIVLLGWICLKPETNLDSNSVDDFQGYRSGYEQNEKYLRTTRSRMLELQAGHLISQAYVLPFPYLCQIYHLLNLKHLENVHSFSLNNIKIVNVSHFNPTSIGGVIKFQTVLDSPINTLRIWRQPVVEAELILHNPFTVELSIPVYNDKKITVLFNVFPLNNARHRFLIDIYSDLKWPKILLKAILHFAACLTLYEDIPYLHKLAERKLERLMSLNAVSNHETMKLFQRFVDLYGASIEPLQLSGSSSLPADV
jgi:hypothetical protein